MNLDDAQRRTVAEWIAQGQKLSDIQKRLADELGVHLTYMEVRLLVDDLKLTPKDAEPTKPIELAGNRGPARAPVPNQRTEPDNEVGEMLREEPSAAGAPGVAVRVDQVTRPGALVSGSVTL